MKRARMILAAILLACAPAWAAPETVNVTADAQTEVTDGNYAAARNRCLEAALKNAARMAAMELVGERADELKLKIEELIAKKGSSFVMNFKMLEPEQAPAPGIMRVRVSAAVLTEDLRAAIGLDTDQPDETASAVPSPEPVRLEAKTIAPLAPSQPPRPEISMVFLVEESIGGKRGGFGPGAPDAVERRISESLARDGVRVLSRAEAFGAGLAPEVASAVRGNLAAAGFIATTLGAGATACGLFFEDTVSGKTGVAIVASINLKIVKAGTNVPLASISKTGAFIREATGARARDKLVDASLRELLHAANAAYREQPALSGANPR